MGKAKPHRRTARRLAATKQAAREQPTTDRRAASSRPPVKPSATTRYGAWATGRASVLLSLLLLFAATFVWFSSFSFHTITADDLNVWSYFAGHPSLGDVLTNDAASKWRPVTSLVQYVLFQVFPNDHRSWVAFSTVLDCTIVAALFFLIRKLAKGDSIIAVMGGLLYVTSRFSYYNILQLNGVMEALGLLFLVLIMYVSVRFYEDSRRWPGIALVGLYLLISLTHERYLALLPFLLLVPLFHGSLSRRSKAGLLALMCTPFVFNVVVKQFALGITPLMGTGGQPIAVSPLQVVGFMAAGLANMTWINAGPAYLSGISFLHMDARWQFLVLVIFVALLAIVIWTAMRTIRLRDPAVRWRELRGFGLWGVLFLSMLLAASITFRQEYRWLYAPFVVLLVYFCHQYSRLPIRAVPKYGVLALISILAVTTDSYYKANERNVFFMGWQASGDAAYDLTIGTYGQAMRDRTLYVENDPDLSGVFAGDLFLSPYLGKDYRKIVWVDSFAEIDPSTIDRAKSLFMWWDRSQSPARLVASESDPTVFGVLRGDGWYGDDWIGSEGRAGVTTPSATDVGITVFVPAFVPANQVVIRIDESVVFDASVAGGTTRSLTAHLHRGLNAVRVTCQRAVSPASLGLGADVRPLGCQVTVVKP